MATDNLRPSPCRCPSVRIFPRSTIVVREDTRDVASLASQMQTLVNAPMSAAIKPFGHSLNSPPPHESKLYGLFSLR